MRGKAGRCDVVCREEDSELDGDCRIAVAERFSTVLSPRFHGDGEDKNLLVAGGVCRMSPSTWG